MPYWKKLHMCLNTYRRVFFIHDMHIYSKISHMICRDSTPMSLILGCRVALDVSGSPFGFLPRPQCVKWCSLLSENVFEMIRYRKNFADTISSSRGTISSTDGRTPAPDTRSPGNSPHKGQWRGARYILCSAPGWVNNREAGDFRRHCANYDVTAM